MKKIIFALFTLIAVTLVGCHEEYDIPELPSESDARIVRVSIKVTDVPYQGQRTFYNHELKEVIVQVLPEYDWSTFTVYVTPTLYSSMTPYSGTQQDWSSGSKTYTITSGDESVSNTYTVRIVEVEEFGNNHPWG